MKIHTLTVFCLLFILLNYRLEVYAQAPDNEVINYTTSCKVDKNHKLTIVRSYLIQINNKQGENLTDISIPYSTNNKVYDIKGWILDKNGLTIRNLKKSDITDVSTYYRQEIFYADHFQKNFTLKHNNYPYQIFYSYRTEEKEFLYIDYWNPVIHSETPTKHANLKIEVPKEYAVNIHQYKISDYKTEISETTITYHWQSMHLSPIKSEAFFSSEAALIPTVAVVPVNFQYGIGGNMKSWVSYGDWLHELSRGLNVLPLAEKEKVKELIKGENNPKEKIRILYQYMQDNTRYINVSIGIGGMKPHPAEYVSINKYGDCKALTNYMQALLETAGISSFCVDVLAGDYPKEIVKSFPSQQFNHVILCVPIEKDTIWLENTSNIVPAGYVGTFIQNRYGLLIDKGRSRLVKIPPLKIEDVEERQEIFYKIDEGNKVTAEINYTFKGEMYEAYNYMKKNFPQDIQKIILLKYLPFNNFELDKWNISSPDRNTSQLRMQLSLSLKNFISKYEENIIVRPQPVLLPLLPAPGERKLPVQINFPINRIDSMVFSISPIHSIKKLSEDINIVTSFGSYSMQLKQAENQIIITRTLKLLAGEYSLEEYPSFYSFIQDLKTKDQKSYINLAQK